ncbi:MAG: hypothetical protein Kow0092_27400 [Deferrisomatales bacterium]
MAHELEQVGLLLDPDAPVEVFEQVPGAAVAAVEPHGAAGREAPYEVLEVPAPRPQDQAVVVGHQRPGEPLGLAGFDEQGESAQELLPALVVPEDGRPGDRGLPFDGLRNPSDPVRPAPPARSRPRRAYSPPPGALPPDDTGRSAVDGRCVIEYGVDVCAVV